MKIRLLAGWGVMVIAAAAAIPPVPLHAKEMHLVWTTFMRNYPSVHAMVIDEIAHDRIINVLGCDQDHWCKVEYGRAVGYIEESALSGEVGRLGLRGPLDPNTGCFEADSPAYVGMRGELFCGVHSNHPSPR